MNETRSGEIIAWGKEALMVESEALRQAAERLDHQFVGVVEAVLSTEGKVILTGLGKSGHIARKISATLASVGSSSIFIHPSEALHGDFGTIGRKDILIAVAFGGETREVIEVMKFARRLGVKTAAICGKSSSTVGRLADYYLDGSVEREACPLNLAPTSSTTVAVGIGDALAVALMNARGFKESDFAFFHPDGSLGRRLSLVSDHLRPIENVGLLRFEDDLHKILESVTKSNYGIAAVLDERGHLVGAITDGDLRRAFTKHEASVFALRARDLMTVNPKSIDSGAFAVDAFRSMEKHHITAIFVVSGDNGESKLMGLVRMHDLLESRVV